MAREVVRVEGLRELEEALKGVATDIGPRQARTALRGALQKTLAPMAATAKALAPEFVGTRTVRNRRTGQVRTIKGGRLKRSIKVGGTLSKSQKSATVKGSMVEVYMGPSGVPEGIQEEFGNFRQKPRPFMRPAWEQHKDKALDDLKTHLWTLITKAVARHARKQAKASGQ